MARNCASSFKNKPAMPTMVSRSPIAPRIGFFAITVLTAPTSAAIEQTAKKMLPTVIA